MVDIMKLYYMQKQNTTLINILLIFSIFYFFFGFVLLRNAPAYLLFAVFFYYSYRNLKFDYVLLTPFMHMSSILILIVYFYKWKKYYLFFVTICILVPIFFLVSMPYLESIDFFRYVLWKINDYTKANIVIGYMHWLFFAFITVLFLLGIILYKKRMLHPFLVTTAFFYYVCYFVNPIMAFRFTPYVLFALLFLNSDPLKKQIVRILNFSSVFLCVIYLFILYHTHNKLILI